MKRRYLSILGSLIMLPLLHCAGAALTPARIEHFSPFVGQGPCDERNGPCPPRTLRAELTWNTRGADLDLHCLMDEASHGTSRLWFSIADANRYTPEPRPVFGGNRHFLGDIEDAGAAEVMVAEPVEPSRPYTFGVHFHTRYLESAGSTEATLRLFCEGREVARYTRTLSASGLGELDHDFWRVAEVVADARFGCAVRDIDRVVRTEEVHQSMERRDED